MARRVQLRGTERTVLLVLARAKFGLSCRQIANLEHLCVDEVYQSLVALSRKGFTVKRTLITGTGGLALAHFCTPQGKERLMTRLELEFRDAIANMDAVQEMQ